MNRQIEEVTRRIEESSSHIPPASSLPAPQPDINVINELQELRAMHNRLDKAARETSRRNTTSSRQMETNLDALQTELDRLRVRDDMYRTADLLVQCRWLLEYLPGKGVYGEGGHRWKQFREKEWKRRKSGVHPLKNLTDDDYSQGKKLYDTLSKKIHNYGSQRGDRLAPEVQRLVDAIRPINYDEDGRVMLAAERDRWNA